MTRSPLRRDGEITATGAAREPGGSTGLYSSHLRRLAQFGDFLPADYRRVIGEARSPGSSTCTYSGLLAVFDNVLGGASPDDLEKFYTGNAERLYRV